MAVQFQDEISEEDPYLEKPSGRKNRIEKTTKAKERSKHRKDREQREYEDGFGGNYT